MGGNYSVHVGYAQYNPAFTSFHGSNVPKGPMHIGAFNCAPELPASVKLFVSCLSEKDKGILKTTLREARKNPKSQMQITVKFLDTNHITLIQDGVKPNENDYDEDIDEEGEDEERLERLERRRQRSWISVNNICLMANLVSGVLGIL